MSRFLFWAKLSLLLTYGVILAGTVVRATGSGMGCPDWPKCFGRWIPPVKQSELPANYKEVYKGKHFEIAEFNALKTWTEYINRLWGALLGLSTVVVFSLAFNFWKKDKRLVYLCFAAVFLIGFQGWLGALVVSSNLAPVRITIHMLVALLILALSIYIIHRAKTHTASAYPVRTVLPPFLKYLLLLTIMISVIQVLVGTQVREEVDTIAVAMNNQQRETWIGQLGTFFQVHRLLALAVLAVNVALAYILLYKNRFNSLVRSNTIALVVLLITEFLVGVILNYFAIPAFFQPVHLLLASVVFGIQVHLLIVLTDKQERSMTSST